MAKKSAKRATNVGSAKVADKKRPTKNLPESKSIQKNKITEHRTVMDRLNRRVQKHTGAKKK